MSSPRSSGEAGCTNDTQLRQEAATAPHGRHWIPLHCNSSLAIPFVSEIINARLPSLTIIISIRPRSKTWHSSSFTSALEGTTIR
jgi:hypothetical protein